MFRRNALAKGVNVLQKKIVGAVRIKNVSAKMTALAHIAAKRLLSCPLVGVDAAMDVSSRIVKDSDEGNAYLCYDGPITKE